MVTRNKFVGAAVTLSFALLGQIPAQAQLTYGGISSTTLQSTDVFGNPLPPQLYQSNSIIIFKSPLQVFDPFTGVVTQETNPFNLFISPPAAQISATGAVSIFSAVETSGLSGGTFLQQFWQLQPVDSLTFQGVFTDSQFGNLANQPNLINAPYPLPGGIDIGSFPYPLAQGTQMVGQFTSDFSQLRIQISGNTADLAHPFFSDITAVLLSQLQPASPPPPDLNAAAAPAPPDMSFQTAAAPEPITITGVATAIGLGSWLRRRGKTRQPLS